MRNVHGKHNPAFSCNAFVDICYVLVFRLVIVYQISESIQNLEEIPRPFNFHKPGTMCWTFLSKKTMTDEELPPLPFEVIFLKDLV